MQYYPSNIMYQSCRCNFLNTFTAESTQYKNWFYGKIKIIFLRKRNKYKYFILLIQFSYRSEIIERLSIKKQMGNLYLYFILKQI